MVTASAHEMEITSVWSSIALPVRLSTAVTTAYPLFPKEQDYRNSIGSQNGNNFRLVFDYSSSSIVHCSGYCIPSEFCHRTCGIIRVISSVLPVLDWYPDFEKAD